MSFLKGYLTYILAILAVLGGIAGYFLQIVDSETAMAMIWGGLAVFGLRRAIGV